MRAVPLQSGGLSNNDQRVIHKYFQKFFEYIDAQKLRTPKGLDWIKSRYPNLTQVDLMLEMQQLRRMHCTMWFECVREIVSAERNLSTTLRHRRFLFTDSFLPLWKWRVG